MGRGKARTAQNTQKEKEKRGVFIIEARSAIGGGSGDSITQRRSGGSPIRPPAILLFGHRDGCATPGKER